MTTSSEESIDNVETYLKEWANQDKNEQQIALLGEYGQGKSVLSLKFALDLINEFSKRTPIIIELRGKSPRNETISTLIAGWALRFNYNVKAIHKLLEEGRLIVILEGFDELDMVGDKLRRLEHFKKLWEFARYKKSKVMITGRPNLFLNNIEARNYLHLNNENSALFQVKAIHLGTFNREKIELALRNVSANISEQILSLYDQGVAGIGFNDLISRPSTLYQTSVIWNDLDKNNLTSANVINEFINHAYRRQEEKLRTIGRTGVETVLTVKERNYFMQGIALGMIKLNGYSNQIPERQLRMMVARLFYDIPEELSIDHSSGIPLLKRLNNSPTAFASVFNDVRTSGILVRDLTGADRFKFAHKSFMELLFAKLVVSLIKKDDNESICNQICLPLSLDKGIFQLNFSEEVIGHITELTLDHINEFDNSTALSLLKNIRPELLYIDRFVFKKHLGINVVGLIFFLLGTVCFYLFDNITGIKLDTSVIVVSAVSLFILMFIFEYMLKKHFSKKESVAYLIYTKICHKFSYNVDDCCLLSNNLKVFFSDKLKGIDNVIDTYLAAHSRIVKQISAQSEELIKRKEK